MTDKRLSIVSVPDPILREKLPMVERFDAELSGLAAEMIRLMHEAEGVGLAANQVGERCQLFVYGLSQSFDWHGKKVMPFAPRAVVNPVVTVLDQTTELMDEGCLSIPGISGPVARPIRVRLDGFDLTGTPIQRLAEGYEARIIQHEVDHLNGILFLDHITDPSKITVEAPDE